MPEDNLRDMPPPHRVPGLIRLLLQIDKPNSDYQVPRDIIYQLALTAYQLGGLINRLIIRFYVTY